MGRQRMSYEVLDKLIKDFLALGLNSPSFAWQGGEPMLMGLDFYKKVVELQKKYSQPGQVISNALQTNGVLLDDKWCSFLSENSFLVGISLDGPEDLHDYYRIDLGGNGTHKRVIAAIENCKRHNVEFNTLTLVNRKTGDEPDRIFDFLLENDVTFAQFIPCFEIDPSTGEVAEFSVDPEQYGDFLCRLFDRWYEYGPEKISIRDFESMASFYLAGHHTICTYGPKCDHYIVIEHTGNVYACDFFVNSEFHLGNIFDTPIEKLASCPAKRNFARFKKKNPTNCLICPHRDICRGGCPKDRLKDGKVAFDGLSYLCPAYKKFFTYAKPRLAQLAAKVQSGQFETQKPMP